MIVYTLYTFVHTTAVAEEVFASSTAPSAAGARPWMRERRAAAAVEAVTMLVEVVVVVLLSVNVGVLV